MNTVRALAGLYGRVAAFRVGATRHQPLRFAGQEYDDFAGDREYNIFRWYRELWGRYTQADPIGLTGGPNSYAYADENPGATMDRVGLLSVTMLGAPNTEIQRLCKSRGALGCASLDFEKPTCRCVEARDLQTKRSVWIARPRLVFKGIRLFYSTDCYDTSKVISEEMRHVREYQRSATELTERTREFDGTRFASRAECKNACFLWETETWRDIGGGWDTWIDLTHPWRRCDGSYF